MKIIMIAAIIFLYLVGIGCFYHIFRKNIHFVQYVQYTDKVENTTGLSPHAKACWLTIVWPIVFIPIISWTVIKNLDKGE